MSHPLLTAPIGRSLWRLAGPTTGLMVLQIGVALAETWIVGRLGTDALAGYVLVIPFMALYFKRKRRLAAFGRQLPEALELIGRALRAGHSLASGFKLVADEMPSPISTECGAAG